MIEFPSGTVRRTITGPPLVSSRRAKSSFVMTRPGIDKPIPAISTGNFGFPMDRAARVMLTEIHRYLQGGTKLEKVTVCLYGDDAFQTFRQELRRGFR